MNRRGHTRGISWRSRREFAEHGIAGARIERIVSAARTNKAQLYAYFGNKDKLFDTIFFRWSGS
ncbi:helix-turn-helix domain-containing protein [Microbispora bryophytorum]|uniref:helix-turn-helix domain-containing protein n=1 Tax=Microbispora bryophytorum TaxID=1460882 RepID=UPI003408D224